VKIAARALFAAGLWLTLSGGYIHAKAALAQVLIERAWADARTGGSGARPWPWADTWPVASLEAPRLGVRLVALEGDSGRTLAFGPGHAPGSALPGQPGLALFSGHRDTHFGFLGALKKWDVLFASTDPATTHVFIVTSMEVVDSRNARIADDGAGYRLALVTCWPLDAATPGGPMRLVVTAEKVGEALEPGGGF